MGSSISSSPRRQRGRHGRPAATLTPSTVAERIYLLDESAESNPFYASWLPLLESPWTVLPASGPDWQPPPDAALVVTMQHYRCPEVSVLRTTVEAGRVPVLVLADGILEYRNAFANPGFPPGSIFQPLLGHKLACIGRSQVRHLEAWGNLGLCELVGMPRLDALPRAPRPRPEQEPFRILVMTAKTPGFTRDQLDRVRRALHDVRQSVAAIPNPGGRPLEVWWRLSQGLDTALGLPAEVNRSSGVDLADLLTQVDALVTTPSTAMLEGMRCGLPVALLDYNNCPHYVPAAWTISAREHVVPVFAELLDPPAPKRLWQDMVLHDALECRTPAAPRMARLVEEMVRIGQECRARNQPLRFPRRILADDQDGHHLPEARFDLCALYPGHPVFANRDRAMLQAEVGHLRALIERLQAETNGQRRELARLAELHGRLEEEGERAAGRTWSSRAARSMRALLSPFPRLSSLINRRTRP